MAASAAAQTPSPSNATPAAPSWSGTASLFTYVVPDDDNYVQPTLAVDRDWLHLEARFNYEDLDTGSVWIGRNFAIGESVALEFTPMAGAVFGNTNGGAIGYAGSITWRSLDLSSETEYVFASEKDHSFLYTWSELGWSPTSWLRAGLAVQRTRAHKSEFDIQRGFFAAVTHQRWELSTYVFDPNADTPTVVIGVAFSF